MIKSYKKLYYAYLELLVVSYGKKVCFWNKSKLNKNANVYIHCIYQNGLAHAYVYFIRKINVLCQIPFLHNNILFRSFLLYCVQRALFELEGKFYIQNKLGQYLVGSMYINLMPFGSCWEIFHFIGNRVWWCLYVQ